MGLMVTPESLSDPASPSTRLKAKIAGTDLYLKPSVSSEGV